MFRLLPWSSVVRGNKVTAGEKSKELPVSQQDSSAMGNHSLHKLKRKRANSGESELAHDVQTSLGNMDSSPDISAVNSNTSGSRSACPAGETPDTDILPTRSSTDHSIRHSSNKCPKTTPESFKVNQAKKSSTRRSMEPSKFGQSLTSQLSLEVLLKHDELRMIDQEIAKCQVALEQLRRCSEIPFPGSHATGPMPSVSNGGGPAVAPASNSALPPSPSPWGVTDGAYTRHYEKWLLPDSRFDGGERGHVMSHGISKGPADGRTTRASWADSTASSSRPQRSAAGSKLQALSNGYPPAKDKVGPMIIKRKSDGQLVKLVCLDCRRDNFSSTQGFINHCRIAHNRSFSSHDAAAAASGEPVKVDESGAAIGGSSEPSTSGPAGYVHPLIRSAHRSESTFKASQPRTDTRRESAPHDISRVRQSESPKQQQILHPRSSSTKPSLKMIDTTQTPPFKASPQTPHLSALMQRRGIDLDLSNIVDDALIKTEIEMASSDDNSDEEPPELTSKSDHTGSQLSVRGSRLPTRTVVPASHPPRPSSQKGLDKRERKPRPPGISRAPVTSYSSPYSPDISAKDNPEIERQHIQNDDIDMIDTNSPDLSPNTVESNQAPSLVSDDGEYEILSESESPIPSSSEPEDNDHAFDNVEVQDGDDGSGGSTSSNAATHISGPAKHHPTAVPRTPTPSTAVGRRKISKLNRGSGDAETDPKQVSFGPPGTPSAKSKKGDGKKQRRG